MGIPRIDVKTGGFVGVAAAVVGGGVQHLRHRSTDVSPSAPLNLCAHCLVTCEALSSLYLLSHVTMTVLLHLTVFADLSMSNFQDVFPVAGCPVSCVSGTTTEAAAGPAPAECTGFAG